VPTARSSGASTRNGGGAQVLPLKGGDAGEMLINDHQVIKGLLERLCQAREKRQRRSVLEKLKAALTIHNAVEENFFYPALEKIGGKKRDAQKLYKETAEADVVVFELDTMLKTGDDKKFEGLAKELQSSILEHIDDEEKKAIPELRKHATPEQEQLVSESIRDFRSKVRVTASR